MSKVEDFSTSLGNLFQCSATLTLKKMCFLVFWRNLLCLSLCPSSLVLSSGTTEKTGSIFFMPSLQVFIYIDKITPELSLLQAGQSQPSWPFLIEQMVQFLHHLCDTLSSVPMSLWGARNWTQHSGCSLTSTKYKGSPPSICLQYFS